MIIEIVVSLLRYFILGCKINKKIYMSTAWIVLKLKYWKFTEEDFRIIKAYLCFQKSYENAGFFVSQLEKGK